MSHTFFALTSAHLDIAVFFVFISIFIVGFALIGNLSLTYDPFFRDPQNPITVDAYSNDYKSLGKMIYSIYILSSYDGYPDNEWFAFQNFKPNVIFFVCFIFLNNFLLTTIPGTLVYNKFR